MAITAVKKSKKPTSDIVFDSIIIVLLTLFTLCIVFPF